MQLDLRRTRPRRPGVLRAIGIALAGICVLGAVLVVASPQWFVDLDTDIVRAAVDHTRDAGTLGWWEFVSSATYPVILYLILLTIAGLAAWRRHYWISAWLAASVALAATLGPFTKLIFNRDRPEWPDPIFEETSLSFPSGHAVGAGVFATALILLTLVVMRRGTWPRRSILALWVAFALLVGADRLFLGVHFPSDVIVGLALGSLTAFVPFMLITRRADLVEAEVVPLTGPRSVAIVYNPIKVGDINEFRARVTEVALREGFTTQLWLETTVEDPGTGQAHDALEAGVDLIVVAGGDGTVRMVCEEAARTGVPVGILPSGTGNLLARNLDLPLNFTEALEVAFNGDERAIDLVHFTATAGEETVESTTFLVMAGLGMDAAIMTGVREDLKAKVGYLAYFVSGLKALAFPATKVHISIDDEEPRSFKARTVVIGNVGYLQGGLPLIPEAEADDGLLDVVVLAPKRFLGWLAIVWRILARRKRGNDRLDRLVGRKVVVRAERSTPMQLDGDPIGEGTEITAEIRPGVLILRCPR